jgi:hypothetical protein
MFPTVFSALLLAGCIGLAASPSGGTPDAEARIDVDRQDGQYHFTALYTGPLTDGLTYQLEVVREGASGRSRSSQGGAVRGDTLSTSVVNVTPGDRVTARLTLREGQTVTAEDVVDETVEG